MGNLLFIIGNGFDIRLGLPTRYSQFIDWYKEQDAPSEFIKEKKENFFSELKKHGDDWKDLEIALGEFTINFQTAEEFRNFYTDINESLYNYLKSIDGKIKVSLDDVVLFYRSLVLFPDIYLK